MKFILLAERPADWFFKIHKGLGEVDNSRFTGVDGWLPADMTPVSTPTCTCDIHLLMRSGCACGNAAKELAAERARRTNDA